MSYSLYAKITLGRREVFEACDAIGIDRPRYITQDSAYEIDHTFLQSFLAASDAIQGSYIEALQGRSGFRLFTVSDMRVLLVRRVLAEEAESYITKATLALPTALTRNQRRHQLGKATRAFRLYLV